MNILSFFKRLFGSNSESSADPAEQTSAPVSTMPSPDVPPESTLADQPGTPSPAAPVSLPPTLNKQPFVDRILETENLTDDLEDPEANWLIEWGIARLDLILQGASDAETAGERVSALMAVMRKMNRIVGGYKDQSLEDLSDELSALDDLSQKAFGRLGYQGGTPATAADNAAHLSQLSPGQALEFLAGRYAPA